MGTLGILVNDFSKHTSTSESSMTAYVVLVCYTVCQILHDF